jgi:glycerol-3-phosphate acyltransferase PlsX
LSQVSSSPGVTAHHPKTGAYDLAIDAMGGDHAPVSVLDGLEIAAERHPEAHFLLVGDEETLKPLLAKRPRAAKACTIRHAPEAIPGDMKPTAALRVRKSSMRIAIDAVAAQEAAGVVSAGNTGALMALGKIVVKSLPEIDRPALAAIGPSARGDVVLLDLGANIVCDARNLVEFAVMGDAFARAVLGLPNPSIGLMNVGSEELKGDERVRLASEMLRASPLATNFHGFVEGHDITAGTVDVIVMDGFTGNVALKTGEGALKLFGGLLKQSFYVLLALQAGLPPCQACFGAAARVDGPAPLQRRRADRPERVGGEEPWRHRRAGLRPCRGCGDGHGDQPGQRSHPGRAGGHALSQPGDRQPHN